MTSCLASLSLRSVSGAEFRTLDEENPGLYPVLQCETLDTFFHSRLLQLIQLCQ